MGERTAPGLLGRDTHPLTLTVQQRVMFTTTRKPLSLIPEGNTHPNFLKY